MTIDTGERGSASISAKHAPPSGASQKTLRVLEAALLEERFTDIVDRAGLPKSTVHRILGSLVEEGFISGDAEHGYRAGERFMNLAGRAMSSLDISSTAQPVVDRLVQAVDCTVHVGVVTGDEVVYIIRTDSSKPYRMRSRVGLAFPLHSTGMGKAAMASWTADEVVRYADRTGLPARTEATITDVESLQVALAEVRAEGYALDLGENEDGTRCVAAPVRDHNGRVTHCLSISSIALEHPDRTIEQLAPQAIAAADEITRLLGGRRGGT